MKIKRFLFFVVMVLVASASFAQMKLGKIQSPDGEANIRERPTTNSRLLFKMYNGNVVHYDYSGTTGWYSVYDNYGYFQGYCYAKLIKPYGSATSSSRTNYWWGTLRASDGFVNVRQRPTTNSGIVCSFDAGTRLMFSGSGSWVKCYGNNGVYLGYVYSRCIIR